MKPEARRGFAAQLAAIPSVRSCLVDREADFVARTWSATVTHVILLNELVKPRHIRRIIGENSRVGIGTLFLLHEALVPPDSLKVEPPETLLALHALHRDKVYTYAEHDTGLRIGQVHFRSYGRMHEYEMWYGPAVAVQNLPCFRVWVKTPASVKGDWLMATFGSEAFWKHADYTMGRDAMRRQQRGGFTHRAAWSDAEWNGGTFVEDEAPPTRTNLGPATRLNRLDTCYAQLGLRAGVSSEEVKSAYRRLARELHPDVSALPKDEAEIRFRLLHEAYTFIKVSNGW
ncbi:MAG: J domain-containing protein [Anaerolineae bacterium]